MDHNFAWDEAYCDYARHITESKNITYKPTPVKKEPKEPIYWELTNGKKIDIDTMTLEHLRNTLKIIVSKDLLKPKL